MKTLAYLRRLKPLTPRSRGNPTTIDLKLKTCVSIFSISASNPQNYFSKRDQLCGEIYLEYTIQRFEPIKQNRNSNPDENHEGEDGDHRVKPRPEATTCKL